MSIEKKDDDKIELFSSKKFRITFYISRVVCVNKNGDMSVFTIYDEIADQHGHHYHDYSITATLNECQAALGNLPFFCCHQSWIINMDYERGYCPRNSGSIHDGMAVMSNGRMVNISRRKEKEYLRIRGEGVVITLPQTKKKPGKAKKESPDSGTSMQKRQKNA